jgi:hypothetical protein
MEMVEENANKVMLALLGTEMRPYTGEEMLMQLEISPQELNRAVELLRDQEMLEIPDGTPREPYSFGTIRITETGKKTFLELKSETSCKM